MQSVNLNYKPSFGGITRYLQREIYDVAKAQKQLLTLPKSEFVGQLPNEILQDIIKKSKTSDEKREKILHIMNGFSNLSNFFATPKGINFKASPPSFWTKIFSFLKPKDPLYKKFKMIYSKQDIDKILAIINMGAEQITKTFQDVGLLKTREKIKLEYLGKGCSGKALRMIFPKRTKYSSKVFKVFKKTEFERKLSTNEIFNIGSGFHEINSMIYIKNAHKGN